MKVFNKKNNNFIIQFLKIISLVVIVLPPDDFKN